ncbi:MAG TPA: 23S rRNA (adenine(2030)-N(6))-methyltransferase RlmJ [Pseudomonadales bacterium]
MLSYRHAFHAGNSADVHKHWLLVLLLEHLQQKEKPFCVIDTHAGDGLYDLQHASAQKTGEHAAGIARVWAAETLPASLARYRARVAINNPDGELRWYPGSPILIRQYLRHSDKAILLEAHPTAYAHLKKALVERGYVSVQQRDALEGLPAIVPPKERRGLVLIDPSYEIKTDYHAIAEMVKQAYRKWPQGIYAIWYPMLAEGRHQHLCRALQGMGVEHVRTELRLRHAESGMAGSGMVVLNPPWQFKEQLQAEGPVLAALMENAVWHCD